MERRINSKLASKSYEKIYKEVFSDKIISSTSFSDTNEDFSWLYEKDNEDIKIKYLSFPLPNWKILVNKIVN